MAYSDRELLARLIQCEAGGEGENGMKAVSGVLGRFMSLQDSRKYLTEILQIL